METTTFKGAISKLRKDKKRRSSQVEFKKREKNTNKEIIKILARGRRYSRREKKERKTQKD